MAALLDKPAVIKPWRNRLSSKAGDQAYDEAGRQPQAQIASQPRPARLCRQVAFGFRTGCRQNSTAPRPATGRNDEIHRPNMLPNAIAFFAAACLTVSLGAAHAATPPVLPLTFTKEPFTLDRATQGRWVSDYMAVMWMANGITDGSPILELAGVMVTSSLLQGEAARSDAGGNEPSPVRAQIDGIEKRRLELIDDIRAWVPGADIGYRRTEKIIDAVVASADQPLQDAFARRAPDQAIAATDALLDKLAARSGKKIDKPDRSDMLRAQAVTVLLAHQQAVGMRSKQDVASHLTRMAEAGLADAWTWIQLARLHRDHEDTGAAAAAAKTALAMATDDQQRYVASAVLDELLFQQGNVPDALKAMQTGVKAARALAAADPSSVSAQNNLAHTLGKSGEAADLLGDLETAQSGLEESLAILQRLAPEHAASELAGAQHALALKLVGDLRAKLGELTQARDLYESSLLIRRRAAEAPLVTVRTQREIVLLLSLLADIDSGAGQLAPSRQRLIEAAGIVDKLALSDPQSLAIVVDASRSLNKLGKAYSDKADFVSASAVYDMSVDLGRKYLAAMPDSRDAKSTLAFALAGRGAMLANAARAPEALTNHEEARQLREELLAKHPSDKDLERELAVNLMAIGRLQLGAGRLDAAEEATQRSHQIYLRLATAKNADARAQRDLSISLGDVAELRAARGDLDAADKLLAQRIALDRRRITEQPASRKVRSDLAYGLVRIASVRMRRNDFRGAREAYAENLAIRQSTAASEPESVDGRHELALAWNRLGRAEAGAGNTAAARTCFDEAMQVFRPLVEAHPGSTGVRRSFWLTLWAMAELPEPTVRWPQVLDAMNKAKADGVFDPSDEEDFVIVKRYAEQ
jgi:tetratricopeptide (TPR) repeat protein